METDATLSIRQKSTSFIQDRTTVLRDTGDKLSNTTQLNQAIASATQNGGGKIIIDAGNYLITYTSSNAFVNMAGAKNIELCGIGKDTTTFVWDEDVWPANIGQDRYMFSLRPDSSNIVFHNFSVDGRFNEIREAGNYLNGAQFHVFNVYNSKRVLIEDIHLYNCMADAIRLIGRPYDTVVNRNYIENCGRSGISFQTGTRLKITNNIIRPPIADQAIDAESFSTKDDVLIEGNSLESGNSGYTFAPVCPGSGFRIINNEIIGNTFIHSPQNTLFSHNRFFGGFSVKSGVGIRLENNEITAGTSNGEEGGVYMVGVPKTVIITGNLIYNTGLGAGIHVDDVQSFLVSNNTLINQGPATTGIRWLGIRAGLYNNAIIIRNNTTIGFQTGITLSAKAIWHSSPINVVSVTNNVSATTNGTTAVPVVVSAAIQNAAASILVSDNLP